MHKKDLQNCHPHTCGCQKEHDDCRCHEHHDCGCQEREHDCKPKPICGGPNNVFPTHYHLITDVCELKEVLSEVFIKFDTDPQFYTKSDYGTLLRSIAQSLIYLYNRDHHSVRYEIVKELPCCGTPGTIYLIEKPEEEQKEDDKYVEYLYVGHKHYELIGGEGGGSVDPYEFPGIISDSEEYLLVEEDEDGVWHLSLSDKAVALLEQIPGIVEQLATLSSKIEGEINRATNVENTLDQKASAAIQSASEAKNAASVAQSTANEAVGKADLAISQANDANTKAGTALGKVEALTPRVKALEDKTLWVKQGEDETQIEADEDGKYVIEIPKACDCKLSQVYTSPYKIGGIEIGDQFGPDCELGDSLEDLVKRMFTIPPVTYTAYMGSLPTADFSAENIKSLDSHVFDSELIGQRTFSTRSYLTIAIPSEFTVYAETVEEPIVSVSDQFSKKEGVEIDGDLYDVYYMAVRSASDPVYNYKIYK